MADSKWCRQNDEYLSKYFVDKIRLRFQQNYFK